MDDFVESTTLLGFPRLMEYRGLRKIFWLLVSAGMYMGLLWAAVVLYQRFTDPTNIIVKSSIEVVTRKPGEGSKAQWARMSERCISLFRC